MRFLVQHSDGGSVWFFLCTGCRQKVPYSLVSVGFFRFIDLHFCCRNALRLSIVKNILVVVLVLIATASNAMASETDPYTLRGQLPDSTKWLNLRMNNALDQSAGKVRSCDAYALQKQIFKEWGGVFYAKIENWSKENPYARFLPIDESIYGAVAKQRGREGWRKLTKFHMYYSPGIVQIGDVVVGDDKLGHFLQVGYSMFYAVNKKKDPRFRDIRSLSQKAAEFAVDDYKFIRESRLQGEPLVMAFADFQENTQWGMGATMVKSYTDIASNYGGYLFWSRLTDGEKPYFSCEKGQWVRTVDFNWQEYVTPAWDEAINCNDYDTEIEQQVGQQIVLRGKGRCPIAPNVCADLIVSLGDKAGHMLHPLCLSAGEKVLNANPVSSTR